MDRQTLEIPAPEKHAPATTRFLHIVRGPLAGQTLAIPDSGAVLGRGDEADLQLMDEGLSRLHARFEAAGDALRITDLGSRNGTHVHGSRIREPVLVYAGELIHAGRIVLRVGRATDLDGGVGDDVYEAATRDPLTGLYNRQYFDDRLRVEFAFARRHRTDFAIVVLNVDRFAHLNDLFGRAIGDRVLRGAAVKLMGTTRVEDVVARYTGDTFIVAARNTNARGAEVLAQRLRTRIATAPSSPGNGPPGITVSAGIAVRGRDQPYDTAGALVDAAFDAMRLAKRWGGDRVVVHVAPVQNTASTSTSYSLAKVGVEVPRAAR